MTHHTETTTDIRPLLDDGHLRAKLRRYVGTLLRESADDAEDVTQDAIVKVIKHPPDDNGALYQYLCQTALNLVRDRARHNRRIYLVSIEAGQEDDSGEHHALDFPDSALSAHDLLVQEETRTRTQNALRLLKPRHRDLLIQHHLQGREVKTIAAELQLPTGTVKSRLSRGREQMHRKLKTYVNPEFNDPSSERIAA